MKLKEQHLPPVLELLFIRVTKMRRYLDVNACVDLLFACGALLFKKRLNVYSRVRFDGGRGLDPMLPLIYDSYF